ncbi:(R)-2-hydroxyisocaproyl-CoA dehydratase beta subunit [Sporomusa silvacetica DSM 10669]|uniref:(R)-2-hydroxyisocaproyl-CoA dehydratase beta subunit n=1 Tax=Sporomusa silvacetica DSM 10669 TaxID=1123289 RepID=A0ABZ3IKP6_9FIRM|nr:2-hydroxyacyl-CoA dehydratase family protein [Sporomusa silvacetica]OZC13444.1 benzoyl-CoA reductase subunit C [Sporomusa silvacetica DSM 10669]
MKSDEKLIFESNLPNSAVQIWKKQGKKVIGTICCHVPEEIIHAAGLLPYRIRATGCTENSQGESWMTSFSCSFASSCLEFLLNGTYDFLDGVITSNGCMHAQRLYDNWRLNDMRSYRQSLTVPRKVSDSAISYYREELVQLKAALEKFSCVAITDEKLENSVKIYNETRRLIRKLYDLRRSESPVITGTQSQKLILAAMSMPKEQYNELLSNYLEEAKGREPLATYSARLMLIGSALDDPEFIKIIEDKGGLVVTDVQCFGSRYLWEPVEIDGDLMTSLATSYLKRPTCHRMVDQHQALFDFIIDMVKNHNVDGIIFEKMHNCDLWGGENLFLEERFKKANIPVLSLQRDEIMTNTMQVGVRVEAFIEMLQGVGI